jgi:F-type H+-transporting ATPase subunit b
VLIDWFTVIAQIVNFLVLVALLKHFLYDRIIGVMEEREEKIKARLDDAEEKKEEAQQEADKYQQKIKELEDNREKKLAEIKEEAERRRKELVQRAREESESLRQQWQESVRKEKDSFLRELRQLTSRQVYHVARRALEDLVEADLQEQVVHAFVDRLKKLEDRQREKISEALREDKNGMVIESGFDLPSKARRNITRTVHEYIADEIEVTYETSPDIMLGIQIKGPGSKIAWSLRGYMQDLEEKVLAALEREAREAKDRGQTTEDSRSNRQIVE